MSLLIRPLAASSAVWLLLSATVLARPNVILIVTDDQGYGELSCHGNPVVKTPHLDQLAKQSVRLTDFHVAPMCTPTRGQLLTGIDCLRNGAMNVSSGRTLLRREFPTLANLLRSAGYTTAQFGKWHLGDNYPFRPQDRGFDECIWYPSSHIGSVPDAWENDYFDDIYWHRGQRQRFEGYTTDMLFREAMSWMKSRRDANAQQPQFVYLATAAAHGPLYVPEKYRDAVRPRLQAALGQLSPLNPNEQEQLVRYLAMVENIDENIGRLEAFLAAEKMHDDTIVVWLTDNGSTWGPRYFNANMRGGKVTLWEGGHRVPCFIRWPNGKLGAPRDESALTQVQDLVPTLADLCDIAAPTTDGLSLAKLLRNETPSLPDRMLVINYSRMPTAGHESEVVPTPEGAAVLWNRWRFLENKSLYHLATDPRQEHDVAAQHPDVVKKMRSHLQTWWNGVKGRLNEPERIVIGSDRENPLMLTACEWWDVFIDQQAQVRRGERKNGIWHLEVAEPGEYEIELRRWPREANLALSASSPAAKLADGQLPAGVTLPIAKASLEIGGRSQSLDVAASATSAAFRIKLERGKTELKTTFSDAAGNPLLGAYYAYVQRLTNPAATGSVSKHRKTAVTIDGDKFRINGEPTYRGREWRGHSIEGLLLNSRMVQAIFDDRNEATRGRWAYPDTKTWDPRRNTDEFLSQMPIWRSQGLLAMTLNLQGGSPEGYSAIQPWHNSALNADGSLDPAYMRRLAQVLDRADELGMVVILGVYYFGQDQRITDEAAIISGVDATVDWLLDRRYTNVLLEINNECNVKSYDHEILKPDRVHELIERAARRSAERGQRLLVGTSYGGNAIPRPNVVRASDFLLLHGNGVKEPARIAEMVRQARQVQGYRPMPILFNEDDHFEFDQPSNNFVSAISEFASWSYFDYRMKDEGFDEGFQSVPVNWSLSSPRKRGFFRLLSEITGQ